MADFSKGRYSYTQGVEIGHVFAGGEEAEFLFGRGTQIFPNLPVAIYGGCAARVVADAGEKWFELGFRIDTFLAGNGAAGWTDSANYLKIEAQWSPDLVTWSMGKFVAAPVPVVDLGGGIYEYWSRALNPQDSAVKTGQLVVGQANGDTRNNGFTSLYMLGVAQALPNFPYDMSVSGTAAQLQADLIALGWTGAIVTGATAATWSIYIPDVAYSTYSQHSWVGFPGYVVTSPLGSSWVDRLMFQGAYVDAAGTAIFKRAFARLKLSAGTRYDPYL